MSESPNPSQKQIVKKITDSFRKKTRVTDLLTQLIQSKH